MAPKMRIVFDDNIRMYSPGQIVRGHVEISTKKKVSCKVLHLQVEGLSFVDMNNRTDKKGAFKSDDTVSATEVYYNEDFQLLGKTSKQSLTEGTHRFNFEMPLPLLTPSSFESKHGYVRHYCKARLDYGLSLIPELTCSEFFTVLCPLDLNKQTISKQPICEMQETKAKLLTIRSGVISLMAKASHSGYVAGESIQVHIECNNRSKRTLLETKIEVVQTITYKVINHSKTIEQVVCAKSRKFEMEQECNVFQEVLQLPSLPSSHLLGCSIIDVGYTLRCSVIPKVGKLDLVVSAPLEIGTVALKEFEKEQASLIQTCPSTPPTATSSFDLPHSTEDLTASSEQVFPSAPPLHTPEPTNMYPDLPPSYEDSLLSAGSHQ